VVWKPAKVMCSWKSGFKFSFGRNKQKKGKVLEFLVEKTEYID